MKNKMIGKIMVFIGAFGLMFAMTGCGKTSESMKGQEEENIRIEALADEKTNDDQEAGKETVLAQTSDESSKPQEEQETASGESGNDTPDETELEGDVKSIGEGSMVVSKIFSYSEDGADIIVSYVGEGPDVVLITVYFSENTEFIVRTVKNGGVNGDADVENRAGAVSDIQEGNTVKMTGGYEGEDFRAKQVIIYRFI